MDDTLENEKQARAAWNRVRAGIKHDILLILNREGELWSFDQDAEIINETLKCGWSKQALSHGIAFMGTKGVVETVQLLRAGYTVSIHGVNYGDSK